MPEFLDSQTVREYLLGLQDRIVTRFETLGGRPFRSDTWEKPGGALLGGGGLTRITEDGELLERGGVGFSHVVGKQLPPSATAHRPDLAGRGFEAMGVSLVFHPRNPHVPTVHMNVRFFVAREPPSALEPPPLGGGRGRETSTGDHAGANAPAWWFGGGMDLTPYYGQVEDARHFHATCQKALAPFGAALHPRFKKWCDDYFFLRHRGEARGVGGIFFDDFNELGFEASFAMMRAVGDAFLDAYVPIVERNSARPYSQRERDFQAYRRGRYVEFNLVYDRGTLFGLQSGGRAESILMSMPPTVTWRYDWRPEPGSPEARLYTDFLPPRDWV